MKPMENPSIFDFATSELSQDAFICYMLNFSEPSKLFLEKCGIKNEKIIEIKQQYPADTVYNGKKYNPLKNKNPDITSDLKDRKIGGLGVFLAKKLSDKISYAYENGKNVLTVGVSIL